MQGVIVESLSGFRPAHGRHAAARRIQRQRRSRSARPGRKLAALESDITKLDAENKQLTSEIQALRADPATIEKFAREELKLVKPGEIVIVTPEN